MDMDMKLRILFAGFVFGLTAMQIVRLLAGIVRARHALKNAYEPYWSDIRATLYEDSPAAITSLGIELGCRLTPPAARPTTHDL